MRIYDGRLGRFLSVDPITKQYPELTPYQFVINRPIDGVDQDGLEWELSTTGERLRQNFWMKVDVANASNRIVQEANKRMHNATISATPAFLTKIEQQEHESMREAEFVKAGYNEDGSLTPLQKLGQNKTWQNFEKNLAIPMIEMAAFEGLGRVLMGPKPPPGFLQAFEDAGGHAILKHVGKTDAELIARIGSGEKIAGASTFSNLKTAEKVVFEALNSKANKKEIATWLDDVAAGVTKRNLTLDYKGIRIISRGIMKGETQVTSRLNATIVLKPTGNGGYNVHTAYTY